MLTFFVSQRSNVTVITGDGTVTKVRDVLVVEEGRCDWIENYSSFPVADDIELWLRQHDGEYIVRLRCPASVRKGIARFFEVYHQQGDMFFDCYAFANLARELQPHLVSEGWKFWKTTERKRLLRPGDTVFLCSKQDGGYLFKHAAIHVDRGLFVSVYGAWGDLHFSTMRDMRKAFPHDCVLYARPRRAKSPP